MMTLDDLTAKYNVGVWLINLKRDVGRLEKMDAQLKRMGLSYQLFEAVDGKASATELVKHVDVDAYESNMGSRLLPGKMGCYASHVRVWELFLASPHQTALILEDDVVFHDDFAQSLELALKARQHWDTLRLNCIRAKMPIVQGYVGKYRLNAYVGPFTGNATYLLNRDVATRILPEIWPQTRAFDHELNRFFVHDFRQFGLEPFSTHVDDGNVSSITGTNFAHVEKFALKQRLPHYRLKAANYWRRFSWLVRNGFLGIGRKKVLY
jgi:glycosyl transferase family 25